MEQTVHNNERLFLEEVTLSGYKSIYDTNITFNKSINIIIGKNAVGKTNFLSFLIKALNFNYENLYEFKSHLVFKNGEIIYISSENRITADDWTEHKILATKKTITKIFFERNGLKGQLQESEKPDDHLLERGILISPTMIWHGVPNKFPFVYQVRFDVDSAGFSSDLFEYINDDSLPYFIKSIAAFFWFSNFSLKQPSGIPTLEKIKKNVSDTFEKINILKPYLKKISPIEDIRFNQNFNIFLEENDKYIISNLFIEFFIDDKWHPFSNLSDGTKRLFYIISEVAFESRYLVTSESIALREPHNINRIILIEEPELGIHPHQLNELMLFLKEQSKKKQIIITTHSPQVLDILNKDELGNIIIASYEKDKGTLLRHLDEGEIAKAQQYMEEDYLSDYWRFSDLEKTKI